MSYLDNIESGQDLTNDRAEQLDIIVGDSDEETMTKDMLSTLVQFLA